MQGHYTDIIYTRVVWSPDEDLVIETFWYFMFHDLAITIKAFQHFLSCLTYILMFGVTGLPSGLVIRQRGQRSKH